MTSPKPYVVVVSGPSGVGKTTVVRRVMDECPLPLTLSTSVTTRQPRAGELDGADYHFLEKNEFLRRREAGDFLESFEVFGRGHWYGTLRDEVASSLAAGKWVVLEIDVNGAMQVVEQYPDAITVFVSPDSFTELERRLRGRATETEERIQRRLEIARDELQFKDRYRHVVVNDDVERATNEIIEILTQSGA
jgi:guanylate kinase